MKNFGTLLKFQFKYKLGFRRIKESIGAMRHGKMAASGAVLLLLLIVACILLPYIILMNVLLSSFQQNGNLAGYFDTLFVLANIITFFTAMLSSYSILFSGKDREILTPLPIRKQYIFLTAYITMYCSSILSALLFILPGIIVYQVKMGFSLIFLLKALIGAVAFPALPLALAFLLMSGVLAVTSGFRHKELFSTIFGVLFIVVFFYLNSNQELMGRFVESGVGYVSAAGKILVNGYLLREALLSGGGAGWFSLLLCIAAAAVLVFLIYLYGGAVYDKILQRMSHVARARESKKRSYKKGAPAAAFYRKEIKTILRSPVYTLNCLINIVLAPVAAFLLGSKSSAMEQVLAGLHIQPEQTDFFFLMMMLVMGLALMALNYTPSTSISREGKCLWIPEIVPVPLKSQVKGRLAAAVLFYVLSGALFVVIFGILLKIRIFYMIYGLLIVFAGSLPYACAGLAVDLAHPKLIWDKEAEAVKQNFNGMLGMLLSIVMMIVYMVPFILYLAKILPAGAVLAGIPVMVLLMLLVTAYILNRKIKEIER